MEKNNSSKNLKSDSSFSENPPTKKRSFTEKLIEKTKSLSSITISNNGGDASPKLGSANSHSFSDKLIEKTKSLAINVDKVPKSSYCYGVVSPKIKVSHESDVKFSARSVEKFTDSIESKNVDETLAKLGFSKA